MPERIITPVKQIAVPCLTAEVQVGDTGIRGISPRQMYVYVPSNARSTVNRDVVDPDAAMVSRGGTRLE